MYNVGSNLFDCRSYTASMGAAIGLRPTFPMIPIIHVIIFHICTIQLLCFTKNVDL